VAGMMMKMAMTMKVGVLVRHMAMMTMTMITMKVMTTN
jgi:hypothetical protein